MHSKCSSIVIISVLLASSFAALPVQIAIGSLFSESPSKLVNRNPANEAGEVSTSVGSSAYVTSSDLDTLNVGLNQAPAPLNFTLVALPDTQYYSQDYPAIFDNQTQWIVENMESMNIVFVSQEGDIVNDPTALSQWNNANHSLSMLDNDGPWAVLPGYNDGVYAVNLTNFNNYFGYARFSGESWYGGGYQDTNTNSFQFFSMGEDQYLIFNFQYDPSSSVLQWANSKISNYPGKRVIVITHNYLDLDGSRTTIGEQIWRKFVKPHADQIFLVLCASVHAEARRTDIVNGHPVYQLLANYQTRDNGGNGWLRIHQFCPAEDKIHVETYSPYLDSFETDWDSQFTLDYNMTNASYTLTVDVAPTGGGTVSRNSTGPYLYGDAVMLTAVPTIGWAFSYWSGDLSGSVNPVVITMDGNKTVTAAFTQLQYSLVISTVGSGNVVLNDTGPYYYGEYVLLTATPDSGWRFSLWEGDLIGSVNPAVIAITKNESVSAVFTQIQYTLTVKSEMSWYWTGNTTVYSTAVADVDGDGAAEIVSGGSFFDGVRYNAQLCVWNGSIHALKNIRTWYWTSDTWIVSVVAGDVDADGSVELVTGGYYFDGTRDIAQLCVWDGATLALENVQTWYWTNNTSIHSVAVADVDADGFMEIVTGGTYNDGARYNAQLCVWNGATLELEHVTTWYWTSDTYINSVTVADFDGDNSSEIATGGYYYDGVRAVAQLVVWAGSSLTLENLRTWYWTGDTVINSVAAGDVDGDGSVEIVTGGCYNDGVWLNAQLCVWDGFSLALGNVRAWRWNNSTEVMSVGIGDVDADGSVEVITGGGYRDDLYYNAQLCVWDGSDFSLKDVAAWRGTLEAGICSVAVSDVDGDSSVEIVTGGYYVDAYSVAQLVVWVEASY